MTEQAQKIEALTFQEVLEGIDEGKAITDFPLAGLIDAAFQLRETMKPINDELKKLKKHQEIIEYAIIQAMEAAGTESQPLLTAGGLTANATYTETEVANVEDWGAVEEFVYTNQAMFLLEKRISAKAWREMKDMQESGKIPGIETFTKVKLSLRKRSSPNLKS